MSASRRRQFSPNRPNRGRIAAVPRCARRSSSGSPSFVNWSGASICGDVHSPCHGYSETPKERLNMADCLAGPKAYIDPYFRIEETQQHQQHELLRAAKGVAWQRETGGNWPAPLQTYTPPPCRLVRVRSAGRSPPSVGMPLRLRSAGRTSSRASETPARSYPVRTPSPVLDGSGSSAVSRNSSGRTGAHRKLAMRPEGRRAIG